MLRLEHQWPAGGDVRRQRFNTLLKKGELDRGERIRMEPIDGGLRWPSQSMSLGLKLHLGPILLASATGILIRKLLI